MLRMQGPVLYYREVNSKIHYFLVEVVDFMSKFVAILAFLYALWYYESGKLLLFCHCILCLSFLLVINANTNN